MAPAAPGTRCRAYPPDNVWNTPIDRLPIHPKSETWLQTMQSSTTNLHPDFGRPPYGFPFAIVDDSHPTVFIDFYYPDESDPGPYPFGSDVPVEQGSDRHALMADAENCYLYEVYDAHWNGGDPWGGSGAIWNLDSNALRPDGWTSADAAGLPVFPGLVRYDEVKAGAIAHAIRFTTELTDRSHLWPARHDAGAASNPNYPPMGARFRLKATFPLSGFGQQARVVLTAMKRYGMFVADNGSNFFFSGTMDSHWTDPLLDELKSVPASAFEAVDESMLMIDPDSGQARQPPP